MSRFREWLSRGEMPDPVDDHYLTAAAVLWPDDPDLPDPDLISPTEET